MDSAWDGEDFQDLWPKTLRERGGITEGIPTQAVPAPPPPTPTPASGDWRNAVGREARMGLWDAVWEDTNAWHRRCRWRRGWWFRLTGRADLRKCTRDRGCRRQGSAGWRMSRAQPGQQLTLFKVGPNGPQLTLCSDISDHDEQECFREFPACRRHPAPASRSGSRRFWAAESLGCLRSPSPRLIST